MYPTFSRTSLIVRFGAPVLCQKIVVPRAGIEPARLRASSILRLWRAGSAGKQWCLEPESNRHAAVRQAADFKSAVSTNFTIEAQGNCETNKGPHAALPPRGPQKQNSPGDGAVDLEARGGVEPPWMDLQSTA